MDNDQSNITSANIKKFKRKYEKALKEGRESFTFEGKEVLVDYAKYVIQYVDNL